MGVRHCGGAERVNEYGLTFEEWYAAARVGEERKLEAYAEAREARPRRWRRWPIGRAHALLAGAPPADPPTRWHVSYYGLSERRAREAWRAGHDPTEYAAAPRPLPRGFGRVGAGCKERA